MKAQAAAQATLNELQAKSVYRDMALRQDVIEVCVKAGNIPLYLAGNIDCKPAPPRAAK
jgi:hypothetical protein